MTGWCSYFATFTTYKAAENRESGKRRWWIEEQKIFSCSRKPVQMVQNALQGVFSCQRWREGFMTRTSEANPVLMVSMLETPGTNTEGSIVSIAL